MKKTFIISLGGSLISPSGGIDIPYLKEFKQAILAEVQKGKRFFIVTGGGFIARQYQKAAQKVSELTKEDLDWLGIHSTRLNGHLLRTIFRHYAHPRVITSPLEKETITEDIVIAAGHRPGRSTDWIATMLAKEYKIDTLINLTNTDYVYDQDPNKFKEARPLTNLTWTEMRKIFRQSWDPGLNLPFDPIAAKLAQKLKLKVAVLNGQNLKNFKNFLENKSFKGTLVT